MVGEVEEPKEYKTLTDYFDDLCPQVLAIGVSYDDFWYGDPEIVGFAIEVEQIKAKRHAIEQDTLAWSIGRYTMLGVGVVMSQAFSKNSQAKYPAEPQLAYELDEQLAEKKRVQDLIRSRDNFLAVANALAVRNQNNNAPAVS